MSDYQYSRKCMRKRTDTPDHRYTCAGGVAAAGDAESRCSSMDDSSLPWGARASRAYTLTRVSTLATHTVIANTEREALVAHGRVHDNPRVCLPAAFRHSAGAERPTVSGWYATRVQHATLRAGIRSGPTGDNGVAGTRDALEFPGSSHRPRSPSAAGTTQLLVERCGIIYPIIWLHQCEELTGKIHPRERAGGGKGWGVHTRLGRDVRVLSVTLHRAESLSSALRPPSGRTFTCA